MLRRESDSPGLFSSGETSNNDCEMQASCGEADAMCVCEVGPCTLYSEAYTPTPRCHAVHHGVFFVPSQDLRLCEHCGRNRRVLTRYSEGYGTEEEGVLSDPQGESDADADIEDTDCRLQEPGSLQRISSRRRKRPRVARQDTTESEDDGGRSHRSHRWNLRLSPDREKSRTILEESISQVRPLVICRSADKQRSRDQRSRLLDRLMSLWPPTNSFLFIVLLLLPLSLSLVLVIVSFFLPWARA